MLVCNRTDSLVLLLEDSTIHTANISNDYYLPVARYDHDIEKSGNPLQSIHPVPELESAEVNFMAVSNKGDRLYFKNNMTAKTEGPTERCQSFRR